MVLKRLSDKVLLFFYSRVRLFRFKKIPLTNFWNAFSGTLYIAGKSLDSRVLDFISLTTINLKKINKIVILTPYSNLDEKFTISWSGLAKYLYDMKIELIMKAPTEEIPSDIFFLDNKSIYFIPRNYFEKEISECCIPINSKIIKNILTACATSEDFTHLKGTEVYHKKFNNLFQINQRYLSHQEKEEVLHSLLLWESTNYEDIEPLWRILERKVRNFIKIRLMQENPTDWFSCRVLPCFEPEIQDKIIERFENSKGKIDNIDAHQNPNVFLVAENYENVMGNKINNSLFKDFRDKSDAKNKKSRGYFQDCVQARNPSIHGRTPDDDMDLYSDTIVKILMTLEWLNRLEPQLL